MYPSVAKRTRRRTAHHVSNGGITCTLFKVSVFTLKTHFLIEKCRSSVSRCPSAIAAKSANIRRRFPKRITQNTLPDRLYPQPPFTFNGYGNNDRSQWQYANSERSLKATEPWVLSNSPNTPHV